MHVLSLSKRVTLKLCTLSEKKSREYSKTQLWDNCNVKLGNKVLAF